MSVWIFGLSFLLGGVLVIAYAYAGTPIQRTPLARFVLEQKVRSRHSSVALQIGAIVAVRQWWRRQMRSIFHPL